MWLLDFLAPLSSPSDRFAVLFTSAAGSTMDSVERRQAPENAELVKRFGTLDRSILELYMAMTGGRDASSGRFFSSSTPLVFSDLPFRPKST